VVKLNAAGSMLLYSTYLGGPVHRDSADSIAVDGSGNAYVTGSTHSSDFPTTVGAYQTTFGGGNTDGFVAKINQAGGGAADLVYSTFLGGNDDETGSGIALDGSGNAYITGRTYSTNFPTTAGAYQRTFAGFRDIFAAKLNPTGSTLVFSTLFGGN